MGADIIFSEANSKSMTESNDYIRYHYGTKTKDTQLRLYMQYPQ